MRQYHSEKVTIQVTPATARALRDCADAGGFSVSFLVRQCLRKGGFINSEAGYRPETPTPASFVGMPPTRSHGGS